ncbi:MAG: protein kinase domain-containing protein, partial [Actinomycetota bacterium]
YLHRHGWLHLDLKPANIVAESGTAKLIDLSIARKPGRGSAGIGTREHMSPEQAAGGVLSEASDVWGIASVLFECLAGRLPFEDHMGEKGEKRYPQLEAPAPSLGRYFDGPPGLIEAIDAGLGAEPVGRPSVAALSRALQGSAGVDPRVPANAAPSP